MPVHAHDYATDPPGATGRSLDGLTLPEVFAAAVRRGGDATALLDGERARTWNAWRTEVDALARGLQEAGIAPGDVVALHLPNSWEYLTLHLAAAEVGAVTMPVHQGNAAADVRALLERVGPAALVLPPRTQEDGGPLAAATLREALPALRAVLVTGDTATPGTRTVTGLLERYSGQRPHPVEVRPESPFLLLPSSGTTSARPKICVHSHDGLLTNSRAATEDSADAYAGTVLTACPLTHCFGLQSAYSALFRAGRQVLLGTWDVDRFFELARREQPTVVVAVPAQLHDMVSRAEGSADGAGFRPDRVLTAGAALPRRWCARCVSPWTRLWWWSGACRRPATAPAAWPGTRRTWPRAAWAAPPGTPRCVSWTRTAARARQVSPANCTTAVPACSAATSASRS